MNDPRPRRALRPVLAGVLLAGAAYVTPVALAERPAGDPAAEAVAASAPHRSAEAMQPVRLALEGPRAGGMPTQPVAQAQASVQPLRVAVPALPVEAAGTGVWALLSSLALLVWIAARRH